ncbi:AraC family transcriptional regulator (plasmid) [Rhizobium leguminosarum bv. trifolii]|nr:AraC family transcriptional regulator [Rhizobium leguminosarum bv. trifolii]
MDPLSDILSLLKPSSYGFRGLDASGDWALAYAADDGIKCFAITAGACWLVMDHDVAPVRLAAGDFVLLPGGGGFRLCSALDVAPIDAFSFFPNVAAGEIGLLNGGGGGCVGVGGYFAFEGMHSEMLLGMLPPIVHIADQADKDGLRIAIERLMRELRAPRPGSSLMGEHLTQALLIESLRLHLEEPSTRTTGWLFALADRPMNAVLAAMHADPSRKWTLATLARVAGMSRSSFAVRFKDSVGEPAMDYLTRWRMMLAANRLANEGMTISLVAPTVGYESESAFGAAFKRAFGYSPKQYAKGSGR